jgi:endo-1,4-beta-xylanase
MFQHRSSVSRRRFLKRCAGTAALGGIGSIGNPNGVFGADKSSEGTNGSETQEAELMAIAASKDAIERHRKADGLIEVRDGGNKPVRGAKINLTLRSHEFLFGNVLNFDPLSDRPTRWSLTSSFELSDLPNTLEPDEPRRARGQRESAPQAPGTVFAERFAGLFNFATILLHWRYLEPTEGRIDYAKIDRRLKWCRDHGVTAKGHPLVWSNTPYGVPQWLPADGKKRLEYAKRWVTDLASRYRDKIKVWDVVNEAVHLRPFDETAKPLWTRTADLDRIADYVEQSLRWARATAPKATLVVNEFDIMSNKDTDRFCLLLEKLVRRGAPLDAVGMQAHPYRFPLGRVKSILDRMARFDRELHITEFSIPSGGDITGSPWGSPWKTGKWTEQEQAEYAVQFYRVCFAHPAVRAVTGWCMNARDSMHKPPLRMGLLYPDASPKPVYTALRELITNEWCTRLSGEANSEGRFPFRGFRGSYEAEVRAAGKTTPLQFTLKAGNKNRFVLRTA